MAGTPGTGTGQLECDRCHKPIDDNDRTKDGVVECKECGLIFDLIHAPMAVDVPIPAPPGAETELEPPMPSRRPIGRKRPQVKIPDRFDVMFEDMQPLPLKPSAIKSMMKQLPYREAAQDMVLTAKRKSRPHARAFIRIRPPRAEVKHWLIACIVVPVILLGLGTVLDIALQLPNVLSSTSILASTIVLLSIFILLRRALNTTTIQLKDGLLRILVAPLSFSRITILADDIVQIWTRRIWSEGPRKETFEVEMSLSNGATHVLMKNLETAEQALYIEQELEYALGLIDVAVPNVLEAALPAEPPTALPGGAKADEAEEAEAEMEAEGERENAHRM